jgi:hypothetical protein
MTDSPAHRILHYVAETGMCPPDDCPFWQINYTGLEPVGRCRHLEEPLQVKPVMSPAGRVVDHATRAHPKCVEAARKVER